MIDENWSEALGKTWDKFCEVMALQDDPDLDNLIPWWTHVFEFGIFMGRHVLHVEADTEEYIPIKNKDSVIRKIKAVNGAHGATLIKAYKIRRYSFRGRVVSPLKKLGQVVYLLGIIVRQYVKENY